VSVDFEILSAEEIKSLSRARQSEYAEKIIMKLIEKNPEQGLTLQEVRSQTPFSISTISKYLDVLLAKRRIYKVSRGSISFYFPNGIPLHQISEKEVGGEKKSFHIALVQNNLGRSVYIQELEVDNIGLKKVVGGITIPTTFAIALSKAISEMVLENVKVEH
jgi:predicted transcriptional regulator